MFEVLMSLKGHLSPYDIKEMARELLPFTEEDNRKVLEGIISGKSDTDLAPIPQGSKTAQKAEETGGYYPQLAYMGMLNAISRNDVSAAKELLSITPPFMTMAAFDKSDAGKSKDAMFAVLKALKGKFYPQDVKDWARKLLPHFETGPERGELAGMIEP